MRRNPYTDLLKRVKEFASKVGNPRTKALWSYDKAEIEKGSSWTMCKLRERIIAARQLSHEVVLTEDAGQIVVSYRELVEVPWQFKY